MNERTNTLKRVYLSFVSGFTIWPNSAKLGARINEKHWKRNMMVRLLFLLLVHCLIVLLKKWRFQNITTQSMDPFFRERPIIVLLNMVGNKVKNGKNSLNMLLNIQWNVTVKAIMHELQQCCLARLGRDEIQGKWSSLPLILVFQVRSD